MNPRLILPGVFLLGMATALPALARDAYGPVRRGEDLWDIARQVYHDRDVSRDQVVLALLEANPQAFDAPCNVNSPLKIGVKLRIPTLAQVEALSREQAAQEFERQLREWEDHRLSGEPLICLPAPPIAAVAPARPATLAPEAASPASPVPTAPSAPGPETARSNVLVIDLAPIWTVIMAFAVFMYVLLDGFDLGVGILYPLAPSVRDRTLMMTTLAPIWDGNETWLVMGGVGLLAAFPIAFAILMPALYFPMLLMLLGLIFRGVAFEFRLKATRWRTVWSAAFFGGSLAAALAQGIILGSYVNGCQVESGRFAGTSWDWLHPFILVTGPGVVAGYALLGATWLVLKTEGDLQAWARRQARRALAATGLFIVGVSLYSPFAHPRIYERWFAEQHWLWLAPLPLATLVLFWVTDAALRRGRSQVGPFIASMGIFALCYAGLAVSLFPYVVPYKITLWQAAATPQSQAFLLIGTLLLLPIILGYTAWSYWVFRGKVSVSSGYG